MKHLRILKGDESYPNLLKLVENAPSHLYISGEIKPEDHEGIAVVGTRRMTQYGGDVIRSIVGDLVRAGLTIVSGLAFGVDVTAQKLALDLGGRTIAVLGSGVNKVSPASNFYVARRIVESGQGALISAYGPDETPSKASYPERDFLMAAISKAVLVIEAAERSGTAYTVSAAVDLGREVFVVPGSIFSEFSAGCHKYIQEGAHLVASSRDIFDVLKIDAERPGERSPTFESNREREIYLALCNKGEVLVDGLSSMLEAPISEMLVALTSLELKGLVVMDGGKVKVI